VWTTTSTIVCTAGAVAGATVRQDRDREPGLGIFAKKEGIIY